MTTDNTLAQPQNHSVRIFDILPGRLLTLTTKGQARWNDTHAPVTAPASLRVTEVIPLRGASAALVTGIPVRNNGRPSLAKNPREVIVSEGAFVVWW